MKGAFARLGTVTVGMLAPASVGRSEGLYDEVAVSVDLESVFEAAVVVALLFSSDVVVPVALVAAVVVSAVLVPPVVVAPVAVAPEVVGPWAKAKATNVSRRSRE